MKLPTQPDKRTELGSQDSRGKMTTISSSSTSTLLKTGMIVVLFMLIGPSLILINQYILKTLNFPYPMFLSGLGILTTGIVSRVLVWLNIVKLERSEAVEGVLWIKRVLPLGIASAATLSFGNMTYLYLEVGFIQMLKAFSPAIIVATSYATGVEYATFPIILSVLIISLGTATTCTFTPSLNMIGIMTMFAAELTEAFRLVLTQYFLQQLKFGVVESGYFLAPASAFWLFTASMYFEIPTMLEKNAFQIMQDHVQYFLLSAMMGVGVNFISYFMIQCTSSLTMKILVQVRNICMVVIGVLLYHEVVTANQAFGYLIALFGFAMYNMAKMGNLDQYFGSKALPTAMPASVNK